MSLRPEPSSLPPEFKVHCLSLSKDRSAFANLRVERHERNTLILVVEQASDPKWVDQRCTIWPHSLIMQKIRNWAVDIHPRDTPSLKVGSLVHLGVTPGTITNRVVVMGVDW